MKRFGAWMAWLGGADPQVLQQVPSARGRFVQMAAVLLTTAGLAVVSMTFALHDGLKLSWFPAVFFGLLWGVVILNLDRFLVLSMGATRSTGHLLAIALPRLGMAIVLALVISTPLVLRVFQSDIAAEMHSTLLDNSRKQAIAEANTKEQQQANELQQKIDGYQSVLNGHLPAAVTSPELDNARAKVHDLEARRDTAQQASDAAYEAWQCELYGAGVNCHNASDRKGPGPLAQAKEQEYGDKQGVLAAAKADLQNAVNAENQAEANVSRTQSTTLEQAQREARDKLPELQKQHSDLQASINARSNLGTELNSKDTGILAQVHALSSLGKHDHALLAAHLAVGALFFLIELLPVVVKILLNLAPMSAYEVVAQYKDDEIKEQASFHRTEARQIEEGKSQTRIAVENHMRGHDKELGQKTNDRVASEMSTVVEVALQVWADQVRQNLAQATPPDPHSTAGSPVGGPFTPSAASTSSPNGRTSSVLPDPNNL
jgi:hypothetical protein